MKIIGVIPARYKSSRFEGKPLAKIKGKPMIIHVAEKVEAALGKENTYIATDDERISKLVKSYGYNSVMTSDSCKTGTDRIWEFAKKINADIYINVQGDEPLVCPKDIIKIMEVKKNHMGSVINGMLHLNEMESPHDINIPKVLVNKDNDLIYLSRLAIPGIKEQGEALPIYLKQVCIYAFTYNELKNFGEMKEKSNFEAFEDIEILRFFDLKTPIKMVMMKKETIAVDNPGDIIKVENILNNS